MLIRDWVDGALVGLLKDQHKHTLVYKLMMVFDRVWREHNWSFAQDVFQFQTFAPFESEVQWIGTKGNDYILTAGKAGDVDREWTGAEIEIVDDDYTLHMKVRQIGNPLAGYEKDVIFLDQALPHDMGVSAVKVFRREFIPRNSLPTAWPSESLNGRLCLRDRPLDDRFFQTYSSIEAGLTLGWASDSSETSRYRIRKPSRVPAPLFAPVLSVTGVSGTKVGIAGTYYMCCVYVDRQAGVISAPGPILTYENADVSGGAAVQMHYGSANTRPEQSYELWLCCSKADPTGYDGEEIVTRISDAMVPFWKQAVHPQAVGAFPAFPLSEDIPLGQRVWPSSECMALFFREIPQLNELYSIEGKAKLPWLADLQDDPPIPREFADLVAHGLRASIAGQEGLSSDQRFLFALSRQIKKDIKKAHVDVVAIRNVRIDAIPVDRYDLDG